MKLLISLFFLLLTIKIYTQIYINEIFPAPNTNQSEWLEIINTSSSELTFNGLIVTNRNSSIKIPETISIPANSYLIILDDTIGFSQFITCKSLVYKLPTFHNDWDFITIRKIDSSLVDSIYYNSKLVKKGFSIERYDWSEPGYHLNNLNISEDKFGHTICKPNSKHINDFELAHNLFFNEGKCTLTLQNKGRLSIDSLLVKIEFRYINDHQEKTKTIPSRESFNLKKKDTAFFEFQINTLFDDEDVDILKEIRIILTYDSIKTRSKRLITSKLSLPKPFTGLLVNEFLFDAYTGCGEFIELTNSTHDTIDISAWKIINSSNKIIVFVSNENKSLEIPPGNYFVVFWDSSFYNCFEELRGKENFYYFKGSFSLRNTGDQIILINKIGVTQDSLSYYPEWHKGKFTSYKQKSLEKQIPVQASFASENWLTSVAPRGGTPGEVNSVSYKQDNKISLTIEPNPFSPYTNSKSQTIISYILPYKQARINVKIYSLNGIEIYTLANNLITSSAGEITWKGETNFGEKVTPGGYVIHFEAIDIINGEVSTKKTTIGVGW